MNTESIQSAEPSVNQPCVNVRRKLLMLWSSLISARNLATFCEENHKALDSFEIVSEPYSSLSTWNQSDLNRYSIILLSYSNRDTLSSEAEKKLILWAQDKHRTKQLPLIVCRESENGLAYGYDWQTVLKAISLKYRIKLVWAKQTMPPLSALLRFESDPAVV
ncbi:MAG: hypothetical protein P1U89_08160 [Verrucomicrobiales bacterium]|nr:hypothetical protein [Verrucomicrobiales bacterium]